MKPIYGDESIIENGKGAMEGYSGD
jgi:hypothetical protein